MHAEYAGKTLKERSMLAEKNIFAMAREILSVAWLKHECMAVSMVFSDLLTDSRTTYTRYNVAILDKMMHDVNTDEETKDWVSWVSRSSMTWMLSGIASAWAQASSYALKSIDGSSIPSELKDLLSKLKEERDDDQDFLEQLRSII